MFIKLEAIKVSKDDYTKINQDQRIHICLSKGQVHPEMMSGLKIVQRTTQLDNWDRHSCSLVAKMIRIPVWDKTSLFQLPGMYKSRTEVAC